MSRKKKKGAKGKQPKELKVVFPEKLEICVRRLLEIIKEAEETETTDDFLEIERRFRIDKESFEKHVKFREDLLLSFILQGWFEFEGAEYRTREIRTGTEVKYVLDRKIKNKDRAYTKFEYEIPIDRDIFEASKELWIWKVEKERHVFEDEKMGWVEVDFYPESGDYVLEKEFEKDEDPKEFEKEYWCEEDVTKTFSSKKLAKFLKEQKENGPEVYSENREEVR